MDTIVPVPDHIIALHRYWREQTPLVEIPSNGNPGYFPTLRIAGRLNASVPKKSYFLTAQKSGGGEQDNEGILYRPRIDVRCYGPDELRAMDLWRYVHRTLIPDSKLGQSQIEAAGCRILHVTFEAGPTPLIEPIDDWPFVLAVYRCTVLQVPV